MEIWDAYDRNGELVGVDLVRGRPVPDGLYHMVCEIVVRHVTGEYLLMQRDWAKPNHPGKWELTAGGSALKGESADQCAHRELLEETGIEGKSFKHFDTIVSDATRSIYHEFFCETDCPKDAVRLQAGETVAYRWCGKEEVLALMEKGRTVPRLEWKLRKLEEYAIYSEKSDTSGL